MRIRRSVTRFFTVMVVPSITAAVVCYFGYYAIWGQRGVLALEDTQARLGVKQQEFVQVREARLRLQHRILLLEPGTVDPDLVEELARGQLMDAAPGQVAVPRSSH